MAEPKGGYFISFEHSRRDVLEDAEANYGRFSVDLSTSDWKPEVRNFFLISLSGNRQVADCAAMATRRRGRTTGGHSYEFSHFVHFEPLAMAKLQRKMSSGARNTVKAREGGRGMWFPPVAFRALLQALFQESPSTERELKTLWNRVNAEDNFDSSVEIQKISMQKDAIGMSLEIAGLSDVRKKEFSRVRTVAQAREVDSFIDLMDSQVPQERALVDHDRSAFEKILSRANSRFAAFRSGSRKLRVWTVDRGPIEHFAGVDLVFLNQDFNSLLLLQYKCMEKERIGEKWSFSPDRQFRLELTRMKHVQEQINARLHSDGELQDIRLNEGALYFKFCKRLPLTKQSGELAEGMTVSLSTTELLLQTSVQRGSMKIGYPTGTRFLNNTLFALLAREGWIGTRGLDRKDYEQILGLTEKGSDRSLVLAESLPAT